jgi:hypothetical protein
LRAVNTIAIAGIAAVTLGGWTAFHSNTMNPAAPPVVTITAHDYYYDPIPAIPSGVVDLRLHNLGKDTHHAAMFRLSNGKTAADFMAAIKNPGPPPVWATPVAGPNAPVPGGTSNAITDLLPGNYVVLCFIDTNGGVPHFMKGMYTGFRVVPRRNPARAPKADASLTLFDYGFKFEPALTSGSHTVRITNTSAQPHEVEIVQLIPGKTAAQLHTWLLGTMTTEAPAVPIGGVVNVAPGSRPEFRVSLTPGKYVAFCFIPDARDGRPHFLHGMEYEFDVP